MKWNWLVVVAVAGTLACSSSPPPTTTTSSTGGTTSGGATSTTGGGTLAAGIACGADTDCQSGVCGVNGTGNCCAHRCSTEDSLCGAADCDPTGACSYPDTTTVCSVCSAGQVTPGTCDGIGLCANPGTPGTCAGNYACNAAGTGCKSTCNSTADCAPGFYCADSNQCVPQIAAGACPENDWCISGVCGINGTGHCCAKPCANAASATNVCGAVDCDDVAGGCVLADSTVACGAAASCTGTRETLAGTCDGKGNCPVLTRACTPFLCGASACISSCTDATSCVSGSFCDTGTASCCPALAAGSTITVDGLGGSDANPCCGYGDNTPCLTIGHAMQLIDNAGAANAIINAVLGGGNDPVGGTWAPAGEVYPIVLGWGVELLAPGITIAEPNPALKPDAGGPRVATFVIGPYSTKDTIGYASIAGTTGYPMTMGISGIPNYAPDQATILVKPGQSLYLANATINGDANGDSNAITAGAGATLMLGQDRAGTQIGTVVIGQPGGNFSKGAYHSDGWIGILCNSCIIEDSPALAGQTGLNMQGQIEADILANEGSTITLTSAPVIGPTTASPSFNTCPTKQDGVVGHVALQLNGTSTLTFKNGVVQCIAGTAFDLHAGSDGGLPILIIDNTTVQNSELGLSVPAGTATVTNSLFQFDVDAVEQSTDGTNVGTVDLSGIGGLGGSNTIVCSSNIESIHGSGPTPGVGTLNNSGAPLNAQNVAWDTPGPDVFDCDGGLGDCACATGGCVKAPGSDGMDVVDIDDSTTATTNSSVSAISCVPVCYGAPACGPGTTCCTTSPNPFQGKSICLPAGRACH